MSQTLLGRDAPTSVAESRAGGERLSEAMPRCLRGAVIALQSRYPNRPRTLVDPATGSWTEVWNEGDDGSSGYKCFDAVARRYESAIVKGRLSVLERCRYFHGTDRCRVTTWITEPGPCSSTLYETWLHGAQYDRYSREEDFLAALRDYLEASQQLAELDAPESTLCWLDENWLEPLEECQGTAARYHETLEDCRLHGGPSRSH
jgi:hypothetical protein